MNQLVILKTPKFRLRTVHDFSTHDWRGKEMEEIYRGFNRKGQLDYSMEYGIVALSYDICFWSLADRFREIAEWCGDQGLRSLDCCVRIGNSPFEQISTMSYGTVDVMFLDAGNAMLYKLAHG